MVHNSNFPFQIEVYRKIYLVMMILKLFYWIWNVEQKVELMFAQYGIIFRHEANKIVPSNLQNYTNQ